jgi:hypothetical protein
MLIVQLMWMVTIGPQIGVQIEDHLEQADLMRPGSVIHCWLVPSENVPKEYPKTSPLPPLSPEAPVLNDLNP